jgi:arylsulfatase A-like enzyme
MLTSVYPSEHGYFNYELAVADDHETLAEILREHGYETYAISTNPHVSRRNGLAQGFDTFLENWAWAGIDANRVNGLFEDWLDERARRKETARKRPVFAMLWYIDNHSPYKASQKFEQQYVDGELLHLVGDRTRSPRKYDLNAEERQVAKQLYRATVASFDSALGRLIADLKRRDLYDDSLIILTSDHGESFWERNGYDDKPMYGHGEALVREQLRVPLVIKFPKSRYHGRVDSRAHGVDLVPTIVDVANIDVASAIKARFRGASLEGPLAMGRQRNAQDLSYAELCSQQIDGPISILVRSIETDSAKMAVMYRYRGRQLDPFAEVLSDPADETLLPANEDDEALETQRIALREAHRNFTAGLRPITPNRAAKEEKNTQLLESLRALGYIE